MNLFELFVKIGVDDQASQNISNIASKLGGGLKTAAKIGTAAITAASTGIAALTTAAVKNYAEYEQLVGGVDTLFKDSSQKVQQYAANAYKTAGLSANEYMSTATSFSASLLQSLGGDTEAAAEYADMAISDMSDNANKMGTDMSLIQNAYQGFAKQNYTMLDNLKLGYGGTKTEMERLVKDAAKVDKSIDANSLSFGNIVAAINVVQKEMGIYGTTALEAEKTISGSLASMKSAWNNLITGVADDTADFDSLVDNMVESVGTFAENIIPRVEIALGGAAKLIEELLPVIVSEIPNILSDVLPDLLVSAQNIITTLIDGIVSNKDLIVEMVFSIATTLIDTFSTILPDLIDVGLQIITSLINGLSQNVNLISASIITIITEISNVLVENLPLLITAVTTLVTNLLKNLPAILETLVAELPTILETLVSSLLENLPTIVEAVLLFIETLITDVLPPLLEALTEMLPDIITQLFDALDELLPILISGIIAIVDGIIQSLPQIIQMLEDELPGIINSLISGIIQLLPTILSGIIQLVMSIIQNLPMIISLLIEELPSLLTTILNAIIDNLPLIIQAIIELVVEIVKNLPTIIKSLIEAIPDIIESLVTAIGEGVEDFVEVGANLVEGLWEGISNSAEWLWENISEWLGDIWDGICEFFDIHSPSRKMGWIGQMIIDGFSGSIKKNGDEAVEATEEMSGGILDVFKRMDAELNTDIGGAFTVTHSSGGSLGMNSKGIVNNFSVYLNDVSLNSLEDIEETATILSEKLAEEYYRKTEAFA